MPMTRQSCASPPPVPKLGLCEAQNCGTEALSPVGGWNNRIVPMLDHACLQTWCEALHGRVKLAQNDVDAPPSHNPDCVSLGSDDQ